MLWCNNISFSNQAHSPRTLQFIGEALILASPIPTTPDALKLLEANRGVVAQLCRRHHTVLHRTVHLHLIFVQFTFDMIWLPWVCSIPVLSVCLFLVGGFATLLSATWKSAPKLLWSGKAIFYTFAKTFSSSHQSLVDILERDYNPSSWLVEIDYLNWSVDNFLKFVKYFYLNFLKIIEIGSTPYRYSARITLWKYFSDNLMVFTYLIET